MGTPLLESYYSYYRMAITISSSTSCWYQVVFLVLCIVVPTSKNEMKNCFHQGDVIIVICYIKTKKKTFNIFGRSKKNCTVCLLPNCLAARKEKFTNSKKNLKGRIFLCASIFYIMGKISISFFSINKIIQITLLISCQGNIDRYVELMIFYSFLSIPDI